MDVDHIILTRFKRFAIPQPNGCWLWLNPSGMKDGYGLFKPAPGQKPVLAHVWAYQAFKGPIPNGMDLDHLCHTNDPECPGGPDCEHRKCCNPDHLEPVTRSVNILRSRHAERGKTHCPKGHEYTDANTARRNGRRFCRQCDRDRKRAT